MNPFLTDNDRDYLRIQHRQMKEKRYPDRIKTILFLDEGFTFEYMNQTYPKALDKLKEICEK